MPPPQTLYRLITAVTLGLLSTGATFAADAEQAPLAASSLLLDGQVVDNRLVAVGERGHILISSDAGISWQQRPAPTRATLTSLFFTDPRHGWAAGHDAVILRTTDGGTSWQKVHEDFASGPVLDLWFRDAATGFAVGAYGLLLATTDGGTTWEDTRLPAADGADLDLHLNHLAAFADGRLVLATEAGQLYLGGNRRPWRRLHLPYQGSMFGTLPLGGDRLLAFGLRGHLFLSPDAGRNWSAVATGTEATLTEAIRLRDGRIVVVGMAGTVLVSRDDGRQFTLIQQADRAGIARVLEAADGTLILLGAQGARRLALPPAGGTP